MEVKKEPTSDASSGDSDDSASDRWAHTATCSPAVWWNPDHSPLGCSHMCRMYTSMTVLPTPYQPPPPPTQPCPPLAQTICPGTVHLQTVRPCPDHLPQNCSSPDSSYPAQTICPGLFISRQFIPCPDHLPQDCSSPDCLHTGLFVSSLSFT